MSAPVRTRLSRVFQWFGLGGLMLALNLFGSVSAGTVAPFSGVHTFFYALGGIGVVCVLIGFLILLVNMPHLWKGE